MNWKTELQQCFGLSDRRFAGHPSDQRHAHKVLGYLIQENIGMDEVEAEVRRFLSTNPKLHADDQVDRVRLFFKAWLTD